MNVWRLQLHSSHNWGLEVDIKDAEHIKRVQNHSQNNQTHFTPSPSLHRSCSFPLLIFYFSFPPLFLCQFLFYSSILQLHPTLRMLMFQSLLQNLNDGCVDYCLSVIAIPCHSCEEAEKGALLPSHSIPCTPWVHFSRSRYNLHARVHFLVKSTS